MFTVRINSKLLNSLRMLADWQLREAGYDPASINAACRQLDGEDDGNITLFPDDGDDLVDLAAEAREARGENHSRAAQ